MRVGLVCPYDWEVPGGVQAHVRDLAEALLGLGHQVSVITPAEDDVDLPPYVVGAGRAVPVPFNGSVARMSFGLVSAARVRRWLREGNFDVLHLHSPEAPSLSMLACMSATGPIVATFHAAHARSRILAAFQPALQTYLEKIHGRIAVSPAARRTIVEHLGGDAALIPNGVALRTFSEAQPLPGWPRSGGTVGFLGRIDEPRKGLAVLLEAFVTLAQERPAVRLLVAGPGDVDEVRSTLPSALRSRVTLLGLVSEADKARVYRSVDVFCAPNLGGESFGIVLLEAMAAGAPVCASNLEAFRLVLGERSAGALTGGAGELVAAGDAVALAKALGGLLDDPARRADLTARGRQVAAFYDWPIIAAQVVGVYETVIAGTAPGVRAAEPPVGTPDPLRAAAADGAPARIVERLGRGWARIGSRS